MWSDIVWYDIIMALTLCGVVWCGVVWCVAPARAGPPQESTVITMVSTMSFITMKEPVYFAVSRGPGHPNVILRRLLPGLELGGTTHWHTVAHVYATLAL